MKDRLFFHVITMLKFFYRVVIWLTYTYKNAFQCSNAPRLNRAYKKKVRGYWKRYLPYLNLNDFRWYQNNGAKFNVGLITDTIFHSRIVPYFNDLKTIDAFSNKCYFSLFFQGYQLPQTIAKNMNGNYMDDEFNFLTESDVLRLCKREKEIVIKPAINHGGGRNISFLQMKDLEDNDFGKLLKRYDSDFIIQRKIIQHDELEKINSSSVNTARVYSFLFKGNVYVLSFFLRTGFPGNNIDNISGGGIAIPVDDNGFFYPFGYDNKMNTYAKHPSGYTFRGNQMPGYHAIIDCVKKLHKRFSYYGIIGWDITVGVNEEPIIVEYNLTDTFIKHSQVVHGPFFRDLTEEVLAEVFHKK